MSKATKAAYESLSEAIQRGGGREPYGEEIMAMEIGYSEGYKQAIIDQNIPEQL